MAIDNSKSTLDAFIEALSSILNAQKSLHVEASSFHVFDFPSATHHQKGPGSPKAEVPDGGFDLIVADLPLGLHKVDIDVCGRTQKFRKNWADIWDATRCLSADGLLISLIEPPGFYSSEGQKFEKALETDGFFVNAFFSPSGLQLPSTSLHPALVAISRTEREGLFVAEIEDREQASEIARAFINDKTGSTLRQGLRLPKGRFRGFQSLFADLQLARLETQYKEYDSYLLGEIAQEINTVKTGEQFSEQDNCVYIPRIGNSPATHDLSQVTIKHQNLYQVVLSEKANDEYVAAYFRSDLGRLILQSATLGAVIPRINLSAIKDAGLALPSLKEQRDIALTHRRLSDLTDAIEDFQSEIALNPRSAEAIKGQLESMLDQIGGLTEADRISALIRTGESQTVEFKESFSLDVKNGKKEKFIELSALKTVVAFLNSAGGHLLVGVSDSGETLGIDAEVNKLFKTRDKYLLHIKNQLKSRIGEQFYPFIKHRLLDIGGSCVLLFECEQASQPCYLDGKDFYVRTNPATDKLEGPKLVEYVRNHFDN